VLQQQVPSVCCLTLSHPGLGCFSFPCCAAFLQEINGTVFGYDPQTDTVMIKEQGTHGGVVNLRLYKAAQLEVCSSTTLQQHHTAAAFSNGIAGPAVAAAQLKGNWSCAGRGQQQLMQGAGLLYMRCTCCPCGRWQCCSTEFSSEPRSVVNARFAATVWPHVPRYAVHVSGASSSSSRQHVNRRFQSHHDSVHVASFCAHIQGACNS
jgi:hypothetical protein